MTLEERIEKMQDMLGFEEDSELLTVYLSHAKNKILNHRFPYGTTLQDVESRYEYDLIELAIVLFNERGAEGQNQHSENGVSRKWRTEHEILSSIPRMVGIPK